MADDLATLQAQRDRLQEIRTKGLRSYEIAGRKLEYKSDAELKAALDDVERRIAGLTRPAVRRVVFSTSKGT